MGPTIETKLIDHHNNITYVVIADRLLAREEVTAVVNEYFNRKGVIKPQYGRTYRLNCLLGLNE